MCDPRTPQPVLPVREPDLLMVPYNARNPINHHLPKFVYRRGMLAEATDLNSMGSRRSVLQCLMNVHRSDHVAESLDVDPQSAFAVLKLWGMTTGDIEAAHRRSIIRQAMAGHRRRIADERISVVYGRHSPHIFLGSLAPLIFSTEHLQLYDHLTGLADIVNRPDLRHRLSILPTAYLPKATSAPIEITCSDRSFAIEQERLTHEPLISALLYGSPSRLPVAQRAEILELTCHRPAVGPMLPRNHTWSPIWVPNARQLMFESGKLQVLDQLLAKLKAEGHRVLVYFQSMSCGLGFLRAHARAYAHALDHGLARILAHLLVRACSIPSPLLHAQMCFFAVTKMIDLIEEYLSFRQYQYLRLDGSSSISERRDMVSDWQTREEIFIFLLTTRAGGLGINLTAADTGMTKHY